ncbi:MAG: 16S rRNA (cytidine(1402)-2'-O)-methyltransferase [Kiloniellales bacterium]|nr:16S rRNA (cytidine(1402)-2'-O)-methyltransferase [Kiloniellales bacterium]
MTASDPATLYVVCTPIGNLADISRRALEVLQSVDVLACEDTRHSRRIFDHYGLTRPPVVLACHEHNEKAAAQRILALLREGRSVALVSDAGAPGVNDPGYRVITAAVEADIPVRVIPGPSAVITALLCSGLPTASFVFKGFPPRKSSQRRRLLEAEAERPETLIFFESPHRLAGLLADAAAVLGDRTAAVCLELTKLHERVARAGLSELAARFAAQKVKGEATVVIAGQSRKEAQERRRARAREDRKARREDRNA